MLVTSTAVVKVTVQLMVPWVNEGGGRNPGAFPVRYTARSRSSLPAP